MLNKQKKIFWKILRVKPIVYMQLKKDQIKKDILRKDKYFLQLQLQKHH